MKKNNRKILIPFQGNDNVSANIDDNDFISENMNELLDMVLDPKLSFEDYIHKKKKQFKNSMHKQELLHTCVVKKGKQL